METMTARRHNESERKQSSALVARRTHFSRLRVVTAYGFGALQGWRYGTPCAGSSDAADACDGWSFAKSHRDEAATNGGFREQARPIRQDGRSTMRVIVLVLGLGMGFALAAGPAQAEIIAASQAQAHVGQVVTVEGTVGGIVTARSGARFLDIGGDFPNNAFAAVIFKDDAGKFPGVDSLRGKTVAVTGSIRLYRGRPEIVLSDPAQLKAK
jgi:hypothetical protein